MYIFYLSRSILLRMRNVQKEVLGNIKTHVLCSITFSRKSCRLQDNVEKHGRTRQATDDNAAHANFLLDTYGYKHTVTSCTTYCCSNTTMVARARLNVTFIRTLPDLLPLQNIHPAYPLLRSAVHQRA